MADVHIDVVRDPRFPEGAAGAWEARLIVDGLTVHTVYLARSREHAIEQATTRWTAIRDDYLADPAPRVERVDLV